jgi:hypothetical protein
MEALKHKLCLSYERIFSDLFIDNYKISFEGVESDDLATLANAKVKAMANVLDGI